MRLGQTLTHPSVRERRLRFYGSQFPGIEICPKQE